MKRELGIARCGLACCLCSENEHCGGCHADDCKDKDWCEVRKCALEKGVAHCFECENAEQCSKGILAKQKPKAFTVFAKKYGEERLLECLERNENNGVVYHRSGIEGDYDGFESVDDLIEFIKAGSRMGERDK